MSKTRAATRPSSRMSSSRRSPGVAITAMRRPGSGPLTPGAVSLSTAAHPALHQLVVVAHREKDHRPAAMGPHLGDQLIVGVEDGGAAAWDGLDDDPLDRGKLPKRVHLFDADVVARDI